MSVVRPLLAQNLFGPTAIGTGLAGGTSGFQVDGIVRRMLARIGPILTTTTTRMDGITIKGIGIAKIITIITTGTIMMTMIATSV